VLSAGEEAGCGRTAFEARRMITNKPVPSSNMAMATLGLISQRY
jgi:hypothetical protein